MNNVVYPCKGPYEDFVYAASFDRNNGLICKPTYTSREKLSGKSKGYPVSRQRYSNDDLRAFVYLVESSLEKEPSEFFFGTFGSWENQGHVSRNILVSTTLADITGPTMSLINLNYETEGSYFILHIQFQLNGCEKVTELIAHFEINGKLKTINFNGENLIKDDYYDQIYGDSKFKHPFPAKNVSFWYTFKCDSEQWSKNQNPESHLVKLRTKENYTVSKKGFIAKNQNKISSVVYRLSLDSDSISKLKIGKFFNSNSLLFNYSDKEASLITLTSLSPDQKGQITSRISKYATKSGMITLGLQFDPSQQSSLIQKAKYGFFIDYLTYENILNRKSKKGKTYIGFSPNNCKPQKNSKFSSQTHLQNPVRNLQKGKFENTHPGTQKVEYKCHSRFVFQEKRQTILQKKNQLSKIESKLQVTFSRIGFTDLAGQLFVMFDEQGEELFRAVAEVKHPYLEGAIGLSHYGAYLLMEGLFTDKFKAKVTISIAKYRDQTFSTDKQKNSVKFRAKVSIQFDKAFKLFIGSDTNDQQSKNNFTLKIEASNANFSLPLEFNPKNVQGDTLLQTVELQNSDLLKLRYGQEVASLRIQIHESKINVRESQTKEPLFVYSSSQNLFESFGSENLDILQNMNQKYLKNAKIDHIPLVFVMLFVIIVLIGVYFYLNKKLNKFEPIIQGGQISTTSSLEQEEQDRIEMSLQEFNEKEELGEEGYMDGSLEDTMEV